MDLTNLRLTTTTFALSAAGVCGASAVVSVALSAPLQMGMGGGKFLTVFTQTTSTVPLHIEHRAMFTDVLGTSQVVPHTLYLASNPQTYGGSAAYPQSLLLFPSGVGGTIPVDQFAGSALHIVVMVASNPASATVVSGSVTLWRV